MGIPAGHRELSSNHSLQDQRRHAERYGRQEGSFNPITGEGASDRPLPTRRPPSGHLQAGLVPVSGPLDPMTVPNKDVSGKKVDPTRNQSASFGTGAFCVPTSSDQPQRTRSRVTEGNLEIGEHGLGAREPTPERRTAPGQVLRGGLRPKDSLSGVACLAADRQDHPLSLPRKAGSAPPGIGSGGFVHIVAGPNGFVPMGIDPYSEDLEVTAAKRTPYTSFKPVWGGV